MRFSGLPPASAWGSEMRRALLPALVVMVAGVVSCSDMPTAPKVSDLPGNILVEGTVTDRDGPALTGGLVVFRRLPLSQNQPSPSFYANIDLNGTFHIAVAQGAYEVRIVPNYDGGLPGVTIPRFEVLTAGTRLDYRYSGTRVTGDITGPGGALLADSYVAAASPVHDVYLSVRAVGGHYSMLLPPGKYEFYADPGIYNGGIPTIEVEADISTSDTLMNYALTGHAVTVTATLGGTTPMPNVQILAESEAIGVRAYATSRLDGSAVLYLPSGGYSFSANPPDGSIVGPERGYWSISGDASFPIDFPGTRWDVTLRRTSDSSAIPFASIYAIEIGSSNRAASTRSDLFGAFRLFVRPNVGYDLYSSGITIPNVSSAADSTFDLFVDFPAP